MQSQKKYFEISVFNKNNQAYRFIQSPERIYYLIVEEGMDFQIKMTGRDNPNDVYGAKLFIDDKEVIYNKTFKSQGHFFGSKLGGGRYKEFVFKVPPLSSEADERHNRSIIDSQRMRDEKVGVVKIVFYLTKPLTTKKRLKQMKKRIEVTPSLRQDNKKFYLNSMTVQEGREFRIKNTYKDYLAKTPGDYHQENVIDYNRQLDEITFKYADFLALQIMGIISLKNIYHLQYIPCGSKLDLNFALTALQTIIEINPNRKLHVNILENEFSLYCQHLLSAYFFDSESVEDFIRRNPKFLRINFDNTVSVPFLGSRDMIPSAIRDGRYVLTEKEKTFIESSRNLTRNSISRQGVEFISLIDDENRQIIEDNIEITKTGINIITGHIIGLDIENRNGPEVINSSVQFHINQNLSNNQNNFHSIFNEMSVDEDVNWRIPTNPSNNGNITNIVELDDEEYELNSFEEEVDKLS